MKRIKKLIGLGLVMVLILSLLSGCGGGNGGAASETIPAKSNTMTEAEYLAVVMPINEKNSKVLGSIGDLFGNSLAGTETWEKYMNEELAKLKENSEKLLDVKGVPAGMQEIHDANSKAAEELIIFAEKVPKAIKGGTDFDMLDDAFFHLEMSTKYITEATDLMNKKNN